MKERRSGEEEEKEVKSVLGITRKDFVKLSGNLEGHYRRSSSRRKVKEEEQVDS